MSKLLAYVVLATACSIGGAKTVYGGCFYVRHTVYTSTDWSWSPSFNTLQEAQQEARWWQNMGAKVQGIYNNCTGQWVAPGGTGGTTKQLWYRSTLYERYLYRDRYGRSYWSNWQSAGTRQSPSRAVVEGEVRGWLSGDPYKTSSGQPLSRYATAIEGFYQ